MRKLTKFLLLMVFLTPFTSAVSVGVSPGFIDIGEVEPGSTQQVEFYITTNSDEEFQVSPQYVSSRSYTGPNGTIDMQEVSEQDITPWIGWTQETYSINPNNSETYTLPSGESVNARGVVTMEVNIPPNAEPGYRIGDIELNPSISGGGGTAGARVLAQTQPTFAFRVPGTVNRDIDMEGLEAIRIGESRVQVIVQLRNTGTSTTRFNGANVRVLNQNNERIGSVLLDPATLSPGEYAEVDGIWRSSNIEGGEYSIEGTGDYSTGETYISGDFALTSSIQERQEIDEASGGQAEDPESAPLTLIVILSFLLGTLLYVLDIELTWVIMLTGATAVTLYILLGSASSVLVLIPLVSIGIMLYL